MQAFQIGVSPFFEALSTHYRSVKNSIDNQCNKHLLQYSPLVAGSELVKRIKVMHWAGAITYV